MGNLFDRKYLIQLILTILGYFLGWLLASLLSFDDFWSNMTKIAFVILVPGLYLFFFVWMSERRS